MAVFHQQPSVSVRLSEAFISSLVIMIGLLGLVTKHCKTIVKEKDGPSWSSTVQRRSSRSTAFPWVVAR